MGYLEDPSTKETMLMGETVTYSVPAIHCDHCATSIRDEVSEVEGVEAIEVDLDAKVVTIRGRELSDERLRAAIEEAGYEAA
jgi:copper chaperone